MNTFQKYRRKLNFLERITDASYSQLFLAWILLNALFTALYFGLSLTHPEHAPTFASQETMLERAFESLYFSVITGTSIGYGDIVPLGFSRFLAMIQAISALLIFAALVGKLVSQRQDATLHEVHRMTLEGVFYHIRHVLFIVRKDFDMLIHKAQKTGMVDPQDWETLSTAFLQAHSLIEEIPDLYNEQVYNVDLNRERLLFESVHRTLMRAEEMLKIFQTQGINWATHAGSERELRRMLDTLDAVMPVWRDRSPFHQEGEFEDIRTTTVQMHDRMKNMLKKN